MSLKTTNLGPRVSFTTSGTNDPSAGVLDIAIPMQASNTANFASATFKPKILTAAPTTSNVADGELSITSLSITSAILVYRSGNTLHVFASTAAE